jgi:hypothetical protein
MFALNVMIGALAGGVFLLIRIIDTIKIISK